VLDRAVARKRAAESARAAEAATRDGDAKKAAEAWQSAAELRPDEPAFRYNLGVSAEQAGERERAIEAYRAALTGARSEVENRALFNVGALALEDAHTALQIAKSKSSELGDALATQATDPDGGPLAGPRLEEAARALKQQAVNTGLQRVGEAVQHLRELVRRDRQDKDALHNLELSQRVRKELEAAQQEMEQSGSSDQKKKQQKEQEKRSGDQGDNEQEGDPEQSKEKSDANDNEQKDQNEGDAGEQSQENNQDDQQQAGPAKELTDKQAERLLQQMLEKAQRRAREVRERQRQGVRRTPVEKDW
jgi:Flp pilus assembly protein TadD